MKESYAEDVVMEPNERGMQDCGNHDISKIKNVWNSLLTERRSLYLKFGYSRLHFSHRYIPLFWSMT